MEFLGCVSAPDGRDLRKAHISRQQLEELKEKNEKGWTAASRAD
jgi:hypothetical protein